MIYPVAFIVALFLSILHVSVLQDVRVLGVTPDLLLIFAACFVVLRSEEESLVVVPMAGLLRDLTTSDPLGTSVLAFAPLVLLAAAAKLRAVDSQFIPALIVASAGSVVYVFLSMAVLALTGRTVDPTASLFKFALPLAIVNALFTPVLYVPMSWFRKTIEPRVLGSRRITSPL